MATKMIETACALAGAHDRVTIVDGWTSLGGQDIFALSITAPNAGVQATSTKVREQLWANPAAVKADLAKDPAATPWRPALMVTANIHGSEGEGTDALMGWASYLAEAKASDPLVPGQTTGPTVGAFLDAYELVLVPSVKEFK